MTCGGNQTRHINLNKAPCGPFVVNWKAKRDPKEQKLSLQSFIRYSVSLGYVGSIYNLNDLKVGLACAAQCPAVGRSAGACAHIAEINFAIGAYLTCRTEGRARAQSRGRPLSSHDLPCIRQVGVNIHVSIYLHCIVDGLMMFPRRWD